MCVTKYRSPGRVRAACMCPLALSPGLVSAYLRNRYVYLWSQLEQLEWIKEEGKKGERKEE